MPPPNHPQKQPAQTPPVVQSPPVQPTSPQVQQPTEPVAPRPHAFKQTLEAGMLTISADSILKFKLCWAQAGASIEALVRHIRDKCVVEGKALYQAAIDHGFKDVILLDKSARIASDGHVEPEKPDLPRELFHDTSANPLGIYGRNVLHLSMTDEFAAAERRKAAAKDVRYGRV